MSQITLRIVSGLSNLFRISAVDYSRFSPSPETPSISYILYSTFFFKVFKSLLAPSSWVAPGQTKINIDAGHVGSQTHRSLDSHPRLVPAPAWTPWRHSRGHTLSPAVKIYWANCRPGGGHFNGPYPCASLFGCHDDSSPVLQLIPPRLSIHFIPFPVLCQ